MLRLGNRVGERVRLALLTGAALLSLVLAWGTAVPSVLANGTPIRLQLTYLDGVSNFGARNAIATGEMITSEAEVRLETANLQKLADNEEYHAWISDGSGNRQRVVAFQVDDAGRAKIDTVVKEGIPERDWNLIVLTVEAKGSQPAAPSEKRAIAGRFSMANPSGAGAPQPKVLPNTGGNAPGTPSGTLGLSTGGLLLLALLAVGGIGFALGRAGARRA